MSSVVTVTEVTEVLIPPESFIVVVNSRRASLALPLAVIFSAPSPPPLMAQDVATQPVRRHRWALLPSQIVAPAGVASASSSGYQEIAEVTVTPDAGAAESGGLTVSTSGDGAELMLVIRLVSPLTVIHEVSSVKLAPSPSVMSTVVVVLDEPSTSESATAACCWRPQQFTRKSPQSGSADAVPGV